MFVCDIYKCNKCECEFYYPTSDRITSATESVYAPICPKCGSEDCNRKY